MRDIFLFDQEVIVMKILVVYQDGLSAQLIRPKFEGLGHEMIEERSKTKAIERMAVDDFDLVLLDPAPLTNPRSLILNARRTVRNYPYMLMMSESLTPAEAGQAGGNDLISKPIDSEALFEKIDNAKRLITLVRQIGDDSEDFPSAGGVIAKSAFNQLFLSAMDRSDRYGEKTYILQISLNNYDEILGMGGAYAADFSVAKLCRYLVLLRRQSDIIGQTGKSEYSLLLQRPIYENEPIEAAGRFVDELAKLNDLDSAKEASVELRVTLLELPSGRRAYEQVFYPGVNEIKTARMN